MFVDHDQLMTTEIQ